MPLPCLCVLTETLEPGFCFGLPFEYFGTRAFSLTPFSMPGANSCRGLGPEERVLPPFSTFVLTSVATMSLTIRSDIDFRLWYLPLWVTPHSTPEYDQWFSSPSESSLLFEGYLLSWCFSDLRNMYMKHMENLLQCWFWAVGLEWGLWFCWCYSSRDHDLSSQRFLPRVLPPQTSFCWAPNSSPFFLISFYQSSYILLFGLSWTLSK